ncbi:AraC family transcriptional regulator [Methylobacterium aquaticum]|uniref:AraC-like ligand-binding domain-containing protein n=1 Tax=Methylobacterium aquaticum TaxID=270351 RepID=UPI001932F6C6|nr:AraC family transcriptional regulator [Methylobacterium aquaticum]
MTVRGPTLCLGGSTSGPRTIPAWREAVAPFWDVEIRKEDTQDFRGRSDVYHLGNAIVGLTAASGLRNERSRGLVARMGVDHVAAQIRIEGRALLRAAGCETPMEPGDVALLDLAQPLSLDSTDYRAVTVIIPRRLFPEGGARLDEAHGVVLRGAEPFGRLVGDHLRAFGETIPRLAPAEARAAAQATALLLSAAGAASGAAADRAVLAARAGLPRHPQPHRCRDRVRRPERGPDLPPLRRVPQRALPPVRAARRRGGVYPPAPARPRLPGACRGRRAGRPGLRDRLSLRLWQPASFATAFRMEFGMSPAEVKAGARADVAPAGRPVQPEPPAGGWDAFYDWVLMLDA